MDWIVLKANPDTERSHLNRILAEIDTTIDGIVAGGAATWGSITGTLSSQTDLQSALDAKQPLDADLTAIAALVPSNDDILQRKAGAWTNRTMAQLKTDLALNNVENTALSTWAGSTNITTLGTVTTGSWTATVIGLAYGGTGADYSSVNSFDVFAGPVGGVPGAPLFRALTAAEIPDMSAYYLPFSSAPPGADRILFWDHSATAWQYLELGTNLTITGTVLDAAGGGGGGSFAAGAVWSTSDAQLDATLTRPVDRPFPDGGTIVACDILGQGGPGSCVIDISKATYASYPTFTSITASAKPTISSAHKSNDSTLTGWTTVINPGDILRFTPETISTFTHLTISLEVA